MTVDPGCPDRTLTLDEIPPDRTPDYLRPLYHSSGRDAYLNDLIIFNFLRKAIEPLRPHVVTIDPLISQCLERESTIAYIGNIDPEWELVLFPVHRDGNHWALALFDRRATTVKYYDPLARSSLLF